MRIDVRNPPRGRDGSREAIAVLLAMLDERSHGTVQDNVRTAQLARETARRFGLPDESVRSIELAARLHDIGKLAISDEILRKPGPLTPEEWTIVRSHTEIGARIIGTAPSLSDVAVLVRAHHERYDGGGYPDGLSREEIPLGAYIIAVCDAFVAMMRQRPYIDAITVVEAIAELERCSGTQFHPRVVDTFREVFDELFV
jgi:two-component system cell cycle response regulator